VSERVVNVSGMVVLSVLVYHDRTKWHFVLRGMVILSGVVVPSGMIVLAGMILLSSVLNDIF
jgi:hypothetical protein